MLRADRCEGTGKAAFDSRDAARARIRASSLDSRGLTVYRCALGDHWHIGHVPPHVARGVVARMSLDEQARRLGETAAATVVRCCPSCGAEGTPRVGVLHAAGCDWTGDDAALPVRR
jgi:hypothetical protein